MSETTFESPAAPDDMPKIPQELPSFDVIALGSDGAILDLNLAVDSELTATHFPAAREGTREGASCNMTCGVNSCGGSCVTCECPSRASRC